MIKHRAEIHHPLLSHFSLLVEFFIGKDPVYNKDSRVLRLVNLTPGVHLALKKERKNFLPKRDLNDRPDMLKFQFLLLFSTTHTFWSLYELAKIAKRWRHFPFFDCCEQSFKWLSQFTPIHPSIHPSSTYSSRNMLNMPIPTLPFPVFFHAIFNYLQFLCKFLAFPTFKLTLLYIYFFFLI